MNAENSKLRLVHGGLHDRARVGGVEVTAAPEDAPPYPVDAAAFEEDTHLVLSAPAELPERPEHPIRVMTAVLEERPVPAGSVVVQNGRPVRLLAVVHDLSEDPTWREEWVASALAEILRHCERHRLAALALPLLGTRHGGLAPERFVELLRGALLAAPGSVARLWLVVPAGPMDLLEGIRA